MTDSFWSSETYQIIKAMKVTGNQPGIIQQWKDAVEAWAKAAPKHPDAQAILSWLPAWQVRPFYTAAELAPIFPALAVALGICPYIKAAKSPTRLAKELDYGGLPSVMLWGERYYICEQVHRWRKARRKSKMSLDEPYTDEARCPSCHRWYRWRELDDEGYCRNCSGEDEDADNFNQ